MSDCDCEKECKFCTSNKQYDQRQVPYEEPLSYLVSEIIRNNLTALNTEFVDKLVLEVTTTIDIGIENVRLTATK